MRKFCGSFFVFVFFLLTLFPSLVFSATDILPTSGSSTMMNEGIMPEPQVISNSPGFLGQEHNYSVVFRGNGEAAVTARIIFTNSSDTSIDQLELRLSSIQAQDVIAYQVIRDSVCSRYETVPLDEDELLTPMPLSSGNLRQGALPQRRTTSRCAEYREPNYYEYYYSNNKYQKASIDLQADTIKVYLPKNIKPNGNGSIILYYRTLGYTKKTLFGSYDFTFETLKVPDTISKIQVGISTDADLYLKGATGKVDYAMKGTLSEAVPMAGVNSFSNTRIDNIYQQIGQGRIVKTASNLQPLDSYKVKSSYADSLLKLHANTILMTLLVIVTLVVLLVFVIRKIYKHFTRQTTDTTSKQPQFVKDVLIVGGTSFLISLAVTVYTVCVFFLMSSMSSIFPYYYELTPFIYIFIIIISVGIYSLLLFGPAVFIGYKKGVKFGVMTFAATIGWLIIGLMFVFFAFFILGTSRNSYPSPIMY